MEKSLFLISIVVFLSLFATQFELYPQQTIDSIEIEKQAKIYSKEWNGESIRHSISLYEESAKLWLQANQSGNATNALREIVKLRILLSEPNEALKTLRDTQEIDKKHKSTSAIIENLVLEFLIQLDLGNLDRCEIILRQAQNLVKLSTDKNNQISVLFATALFYYNKHENLKSIETFEEAINLASEINSTYLKARLLYEESIVLVVSGKYDQSQIKANEALQSWKLINDRRGIALTLLAIGDLEWFKGDKQKALEYYKQSELLFPNDIAFYDNANLLNSFAFVYEDYNNFELSLSHRKKALDYFIKANHPSGQLTTLLRLAELSLLLKDTKSMFLYLKEAEIIARKLDDKYLTAIINSDYGNYYYSLGETKTSELYYKKTLDILDKDIYKRDIGLISLKLGEIELKNNRFFEARRYFKVSFDSNIQTKDKVAFSQTLFHIAKLDLLENKPNDAFKNITESINLTENLYSNVANSNLKRSYFSNVYDRYELYINLLMQKHKQSPNENFVIQALQASEKSRSRSLLETLRLSEANFTKDANPELIQKEKETRNLLSLKADKLTELLSSSAEKSEIEKVEDEIRILENELETIKADLKQQSPIYSAIKSPPPFDVQDFQANVLDDKTLLLEFSFGAEESYLWLVGKNEVNHFTLPKREILESRIQKLLELLKAREISEGEEPESYQKRLIDAESAFESEARLLSNELFGQIADKLAGKRLIIVPDGKLYYFPISALPLPNIADNTPMLETNEIVYEPSAATLQILGKSARPEKLPKELLVFADPIFSVQDNRLSAENKNPTVENDSTAFLGSSLRSFDITDSNNQLKRLFATQEEADAIVKIVGAEHATIASGFAANRQRVFEKDVSDYKIIHFATHGLMNDERPELSGIVLSLFDEKGEAQKGFIRLQDIYSLNLSADLVVLSACQSGIGKEVKGEGLMSLTGGFIQSGANSVLSSLWKVDDYATAELMKNFYQELSTKNLAPSQALRNAQIKMRQNPNFKSPFYWAAFTVQGEFRHPISVNEHRFSYLWIVLAMVFVGLVIYLCVRQKPAR